MKYFRLFSIQTQLPSVFRNGKLDLHSLIFSFLFRMTQVGSQRTAGAWNRSYEHKISPRSSASSNHSRVGLTSPCSALPGEKREQQLFLFSLGFFSF